MTGPTTMYVPKSTELSDQNSILSFIEDHAFATVITQSMNANHLPLLLRRGDEQSEPQLCGHFARPNSDLISQNGQKVLIIFSGPHSYISPTWYQKGPAVPTWNYAAVHVTGTLEFCSEEDTWNDLNALVAKYESSLLSQEQLMPEQYRRKLAKAICGFRVSIDTIVAKEKLGQNKTSGDQLGIYNGLIDHGGLDELSLAHYMRQRISSIEA